MPRLRLQGVLAPQPGSVSKFKLVGYTANYPGGPTECNRAEDPMVQHISVKREQNGELQHVARPYSFVLSAATLAPSLPFNAPRDTMLAPQVEMNPDLRATTFSPQNAYYFARLSKIAYRKKNEVEGLLAGNSTFKGLGFNRFHWFEVCMFVETYLLAQMSSYHRASLPMVWLCSFVLGRSTEILHEPDKHQEYPKPVHLVETKNTKLRTCA